MEIHSEILRGKKTWTVTGMVKGVGPGIKLLDLILPPPLTSNVILGLLCASVLSFIVLR